MSSEKFYSISSQFFVIGVRTETIHRPRGSGMRYAINKQVFFWNAIKKTKKEPFRIDIIINVRLAWLHFFLKICNE